MLTVPVLPAWSPARRVLPLEAICSTIDRNLRELLARKLALRR